MSLQQCEPNSVPEEAKLIARALQDDPDAIRLIMQRYNRRLYRVARSVVRDDGEAEDVVQEAYGRAFTRLHEFRGESSIGSWLARIVLNEALTRLRRRRDAIHWAAVENQQYACEVTAQPDPERALAQREIQLRLQHAIDRLPVRFRTVLIMRLIEEMSIAETAELLAIRPETVKTRLHRARVMLRRELEDALGPSLVDTFPFEGEHCQRLTEKVLARWNASTTQNEQRPFSAEWNSRSPLFAVLFNILGLHRWISAWSRL